MSDRGCVSCGSHSAWLLEKNKDGIVEADSDLTYYVSLVEEPFLPLTEKVTANQEHV